jgi:hypothetical protein
MLYSEFCSGETLHSIGQGSAVSHEIAETSLFRGSERV